MKKNILIISIYYPPIESIASNRIYSFAKYLDKSEYNIFVHTIDTNKPFKNTLEGVEISRTKNSSFFKLFLFEKRTNKLLHYLKVAHNIIVRKLIKNLYQGWIDSSFELLKKKIKEENIDLIISSYAPDASHILALKLKQEFSNIKWIADFRDEMSNSIYLDSKTRAKYYKLEQDIFNNVDAITSVSKPILQHFKSSCNKEGVKFCEVRNGYDFELEYSISNNNIFTISFIGNFYADITPYNFFKALELFINDNRDVKIEVKLVGVKTHFELPNNLKDIVKILPTLKHTKAIEVMKQSDALLLIYPTNKRVGVYTGKLFEYLGSLKPILALVNEDDVAAKLIKKCNAGYVADNSNIGKIKQNIELLYSEWKSKNRRDFNLDIIKKHHRIEQVKRLELAIQKVLNG